VERDHAGVVLAVGVAPGDPLIGQLLGDLGVSLVAGAAELGDPVQVAVVDLADLFDTLHELRKLLELGPLIVSRLDWDLGSMDCSIVDMWAPFVVYGMG